MVMQNETKARGGRRHATFLALVPNVTNDLLVNWAGYSNPPKCTPYSVL